MILLENVNLAYSSLAFREISLKSYIFKLFQGKREKVHDIHALKNISLSIQPGERVGILGGNGAGKSTLLKAIAGLYPISSGTREVHGEVRALFELSLGFEWEATGRENILYRGLLLGQTSRKMKELTQEIIQFADLKNFIDYPIKTYSSGMIVRLAFAISTMISGDILLIDEVIGAGDAKKKKKASERIKELIAQAKILVLVSHDLSALHTFCQRLLLLNRGVLIFDGNVEEGIAHYKELVSQGSYAE